jgi:CPA1 family monovalent cation:H+ antiporter
MVAGRASPRVLDSEARLQSRAVWETTIFVIHGLVFILIGLQLSGILSRLADRDLMWLVGMGALVSLTVILVRFAWVFPATYLPRYLIRSLRERDPYPPWQVVTVLAWAGMRGVVSLAAALALPVVIAGGTPFPERDLLIFLTFCVILVTLVGQGLTLPLLIRVLGVGGDSSADHEKLHARAAANEAAVARIEQLADEWPDHVPLIETLRTQYAHRASHLGEHSHEQGSPSRDGAAERELLEHHLIRRAVIDAEREAVLELRDRGVINDEVFRHLERDLDLEELRMEA